MFYFDFPLDSNGDGGAIFLADYNSGDGLFETYYGDMSHDVYSGTIVFDDGQPGTMHMV